MPRKAPRKSSLIEQEGNKPIMLRLPDWLNDWVKSRAKQNRREHIQEEIVEILRSVAIDKPPANQVLET